MERLKNLDRCQRIILILLAVMLAVFTALYAVNTSRAGYAYRDSILIPVQEGGNTVYDGKIGGNPARFTVTGEGSVTFTYDGKDYGPYTAREDPTAVPEDSPFMTGVEILNNGHIYFRGGVYRSGDSLMLFNEDGGIQLTITATMSDGTVVDGDGNYVDQMAPSAATILELLDGPKLSHKGVWIGWFCGVFMSVMTAVSILFADELFRWNLSFRIQDACCAEPSDWELATRYISWVIMPILTLGVYIMGLNAIV